MAASTRVYVSVAVMSMLADSFVFGFDTAKPKGRKCQESFLVL